MKFPGILIFAAVSAAWPQVAPPAPAPAGLPDLPDQAIIAQFDDGTQMTMGEFRKILATIPPQSQQMILRDRQAFLHQFAVMRKLAKMAETQKLDQQSPYKDQIEFSRTQILATAKLSDEMNTMVIEPDQAIKYYDSNKDRFKQVKVKAIYIGFNNTPAAVNASSAKKLLTEEEAKAKAQKLLTDVRGGANFVELVRKESDDQTSKAKDGDFGTWRANDNIPDALRAAAFALKQGDVSEPIRQPNGFYILKAEEVSYRPIAEVREEIFQKLKQDHYGEWMKELDGGTKVQFPNAAFLGTAPAPVKVPSNPK